MRFALKTLLVFLLTGTVAFAQQEKQYKVKTIAFYNVENLFDYEKDPIANDEDWTPDGRNNWTKENYEDKLKKLARVISEIGAEMTGSAPHILGLAEVENRRVLEDLIAEPALKEFNYDIIHYDSPDSRGIDVALIYRKGHFVPTSHSTHELVMYDANNPDRRYYTRDQLLVSGKLDGDEIHIIVNHWPSRYGGEKRSRPSRVKAAELNKRIMDSIWTVDPYAKILTMGDLNDDPTNASVKEVLKAKAERDNMKMKELYNPMENMHKKGLGTLAYRDAWNLFDQIIISTELAKKEDYSSYRFYQAGIFNKTYLQTPRGQYKGYPFRMFANGGYTGGYSDHFPVYIYVIKEID